MGGRALAPVLGWTDTAPPALSPRPGVDEQGAPCPEPPSWGGRTGRPCPEPEALQEAPGRWRRHLILTLGAGTVHRKP